MKKTALLILCLIIAVMFCACDTPQDITGDAVYRSSSEEETVNTQKNWEHGDPGSEIKMFTITNRTELSFNAVEFKPTGFEGWETVEYDFVSGEQVSLSFASSEFERYKKWDFRMRIDFNLYYTVIAVSVQDNNIVLNGTIDRQTYETAVAK